MTNKPASWWTAFSKGDRRDEDFITLYTEKRGMQLPPVSIEEDALCTMCGTDQDVHIRDRYGYSIEAVKGSYVGSQQLILQDENGWKLYFCVPCAHSWLFPYIEKAVGYTAEKVYDEIMLMTDLSGRSKARILTTSEQDSTNDR